MLRGANGPAIHRRRRRCCQLLSSGARMSAPDAKKYWRACASVRAKTRAHLALACSGGNRMKWLRTRLQIALAAAVPLLVAGTGCPGMTGSTGDLVVGADFATTDEDTAVVVNVLAN